jgi:hypothetical protein
LVDPTGIFEIYVVLNFEIFSKFGCTHHRPTLDTGSSHTDGDAPVPQRWSPSVPFVSNLFGGWASEQKQHDRAKQDLKQMLRQNLVRHDSETMPRSFDADHLNWIVYY